MGSVSLSLSLSLSVFVSVSLSLSNRSLLQPCLSRLSIIGLSVCLSLVSPRRPFPGTGLSDRSLVNSAEMWIYSSIREL
jgi:hypothetical protein